MTKSASDTTVLETDVLVIGGGTAGPMAAVKAKQKNPKLRVTVLEKANVKRSGAISMGMDGLNNAVIPGHATPEQYVKEITIANDGIVNQKTVMAYAERSFDMINLLDDWGVKFEKDETGDYNVKKVHHMGTYVLPMPEGHHMKKILYRQLRRHRVQVVNRYMATRLYTGEDGRMDSSQRPQLWAVPPSAERLAVRRRDVDGHLYRDHGGRTSDYSDRRRLRCRSLSYGDYFPAQYQKYFTALELRRGASPALRGVSFQRGRAAVREARAQAHRVLRAVSGPFW